MPRYWPDRQIDRITPTGAMDARGKAVLRALDRIIGNRPISDFYVRDAETCPSAALPALIAEYSMEEYIEPGLPEPVQRRILKNAWLLQMLQGYDAGVKLGLDLLGITAAIEHWHQQTPMGAPNTHRIRIEMENVLFPDEEGYFAPRQMRAIRNMIDATKRWSQGTEIRLGVSGRAPVYAGIVTLMRRRIRSDVTIDPPPVIETPARVAVHTVVRRIVKVSTA